MSTLGHTSDGVVCSGAMVAAIDFGGAKSLKDIVQFWALLIGCVVVKIQLAVRHYPRGITMTYHGLHDLRFGNRSTIL